MGVCKEDSWTLLSDRARGNAHESERVKFCLNIGKHFFTAVAVEHWHRLPREIVESPP